MAINPDDMEIGQISYMGSDEGGNYTVRNGKKTYRPDFKDMRKRGEDEMPITIQPALPPRFPGTRPPRRPQDPTSGGRFVNDYSFLNLPELGSAVRSPIEIAQESLPPSVLQQIDFSAPQELPEGDLLTRGGTPNIIPTRPQGILGTPNFRNILQTAVTNAEAEIQMLREAKVDLTNQYEQAVAQQDVITAQAAEDQLAAVNAKEQELLTERANIIQELEDKFGVEREELQTNIATLEGTITDLQGSIDALTQERDDAIAEQDVIRATAADEQAKALEAQKTSLEADYADQIATLQTEIDNLSAADVVAEDLPATTDVTVEDSSVVTAPTAEEYMDQLNEPPEKELIRDTYNPDYMGFEDERAIGRQNEADALANLQAASAAGTATLGDVQAAKDASADLIAQQAYENRSIPITGADLGLTKQPNLPVTNPVVEDYAPIRRDTIPTDVVSQLQNMNIQQPNLNFNNLRLGMAGGGDINKIEILLRRLG